MPRAMARLEISHDEPQVRLVLPAINLTAAKAAVALARNIAKETSRYIVWLFFVVVMPLHFNTHS